MCVDSLVDMTFTKWFFFPHFLHLSPHAGQSSEDLCFPFLPQYPQDAFLSHFFRNLVFLDYLFSSLNHLSNFFVSGNHFACVFYCNSLVPPHCVASAVLSDCFDASLLLDLVSVMVLSFNMRARTRPSVVPNTILCLISSSSN